MRWLEYILVLDLYSGKYISSYLFQEIKKELQRQADELEEAQKKSSGGSNPLSKSSSHQNANGHIDRGANGQNQGFFGGALANIFVILGFAIFAYTVKFVLRSVVE